MYSTLFLFVFLFILFQSICTLFYYVPFYSDLLSSFLCYYTIIYSVLKHSTLFYFNLYSILLYFFHSSLSYSTPLSSTLFIILPYFNYFHPNIFYCILFYSVLSPPLVAVDFVVLMCSSLIHFSYWLKCPFLAASLHSLLTHFIPFFQIWKSDFAEWCDPLYRRQTMIIIAVAKIEFN